MSSASMLLIHAVWLLHQCELFVWEVVEDELSFRYTW